MKTLTLVSTLFLLFSCSQAPEKRTKEAELHLYEFPLKKYSKLIEGGFSGLHYEGKNEKNELVFWTHTDRGPNAENFPDEASSQMFRPFVNQHFNPHIVKFTLHPETKTINYFAEIPLTLPDGKPLSGLPNYPARKNKTGDETPVSIEGKKLAFDHLGIDPEGICVLDKEIWMVEEYGPSILRFNPEGKLLTRFVPKNYFNPQDLARIEKRFGKRFIQEILPEELQSRRHNRGFEGIACARDKVYATLQSPLSAKENQVLILELSVSKNTITRKLSYPLDSTAEKIGDLYYFQDDLYIIEQNSEIGTSSIHKIFKIDLKHASTGAPLKKELVADLVKLGFDFADKIEGLVILPNNDIYVLNDNDFGLTGKIDQRLREADVDSNRKSVLGLIKR